jgi:hypothetical protein
MKCSIAYIFLIFWCLASCSHRDENKCSKLKQGEFYYKGIGAMEGSIIDREDSVQTVTDEKTGKKVKEKIVWANPCIYILYPFPESSADVLNSDLFPIKVSILAITKKYYTVHVVSWDHKSDFYDTAWIVTPK